MNKKNKSKKKWLRFRCKDNFFLKSKIIGVRSRSWFKIDEIDKKFNILIKNCNAVDIGSSPGGWSQYASNKIGKFGKVFSCDILPMKYIENVEFYQGDCLNLNFMNKFIKIISNYNIQTIISDISPNKTGISIIDMPKFIKLANIITFMCKSILKFGGNFLIKVFQGKDLDKYYQEICYMFNKVNIYKPLASFKNSRELYIVAKGFKI